jgi:hypothetical protein
MRRLFHPLFALAFSSLFPIGCIVVDHTPDGPPPVVSPPRADVAGEPAVSFPTGTGYHVLAGGSAELPSGDIGYLVTANGQGGYRVVWSDTLNSPAHFSGTVSTDGTFDPAQTHGFSGAESLTYTGANQIAFSSVPGQNLDGIDLVSSTDPIYLDARIDGSEVVNIYFTGATTRALVNSVYNPVAFTSP